jgi:gluconolactonase
MLHRVAQGLSFPESPYYSTRDGCLYLVEWTGNRILSFRHGQLVSLFATAPGSGPSGLGQDAEGHLWATLYDSRQLACYHLSGKLLQVVEACKGRAFRGPCDLVTSPDGRLYFTDSGDFEEDWTSGRPAGWVYFRDHGGKFFAVDHDLCFPNGITLSPDGWRLYVAEHRRNRILQYDLGQDGLPVNRRIFFELDDDCLLEQEAAFELGPDGLCVDGSGNLWAAHYGGGKVLQISAQGELLHAYHMPSGRKPSNVAFHREERAMYITEAESGSLFRLDPAESDVKDPAEA